MTETVPASSSDLEECRKTWLQTARGRLRMELAGLSFAVRHGFTPEDFARHVWSKGAKTWIGKPFPDPDEYLKHEAAAFRKFFPEVSFHIPVDTKDHAELVFDEGCLGTWPENEWKLAKSFGLTKQHICAYCQEAFHLWAEQLGLRACIGPEVDGTCRFIAKRPKASSKKQ